MTKMARGELRDEMVDVTDDISAITAVEFEDEVYDNISDSDSDDEDTMVELLKIQNSNYDYSCTMYSQESSELSLSSCRLNSSELRSQEFPRTPSASRPELFTNPDYDTVSTLSSDYIWKTYHKFDDDEESDIRNNTPMTLDELELDDGL